MPLGRGVGGGPALRRSWAGAGEHSPLPWPPPSCLCAGVRKGDSVEAVGPHFRLLRDGLETSGMTVEVWGEGGVSAEGLHGGGEPGQH